MNTPDPVTAFILKTCQEVKPEEFVTSLKVNGTHWDYYCHRMKDGVEASIAFCIIGGKATIGVFSKGRLTEDQVRQQLEDQETICLREVVARAVNKYLYDNKLMIDHKPSDFQK